MALPDEVVPLSASSLWPAARAFYQQSGIGAWSSNAIPHHVTANPRIARTYAELIRAWARDAQAATDARPTDIHVIELGCGSGRFAHLFLRAWDDLERSADQDLPVLHYVATDLVPGNVAFLLAHHAVRDDVASGRLRGLAFDPLAGIEGGAEPRLPTGDAFSRLRDLLALPGDATTAASLVVVVANYVLDSLPVDVFVTRNGELLEAGVVNGAASLAGDVAVVEWRLVPTTPSARFPDEADLAGLLDEDARGPDRVMTFPSGALRAARQLASLTDGPMLWLVSDKGTIPGDDAPPNVPPDIEVHAGACVSTLVDFDAFARWVRCRGGHVLLPTHGTAALVTCGWVSGPMALPSLRDAFERNVGSSGPGDDFFVTHRLTGANGRYALPEALAVLRWSLGDPYLWADCFPSLMPALAQAGSLRREARDVIGEVARRWYDIGEPVDVGFQLASALLELGAFDEASALLAASVTLRGEQATTLFQRARVDYRRGAPAEALMHLRAALALDGAVESTLQHLGILAEPIAREFEMALRWQLGSSAVSGRAAQGP